MGTLKNILRLIVAMVLILVMALLFGGCKGSTPTTPTSVINEVDRALCNPSDVVKADAASVAAFIQGGLSTAALLYPPAAPISGISVAGIFTTIQRGGCVFAEDLKAALAWFDSLGIGKAAKPSATTLRAWLPKKSEK